MPTTNNPIAGKVSYTVKANGAVALQSGWESANVGTVFIPQLKGKDAYGSPFSGNVRFYKRAIPQLVAAFEELERLGLADKILTWGGSFVTRLMRGGTSISWHGLALAFDVNVPWNPFRAKPAAKGKKGDLHAVAEVFKRFGFDWGGDWKNTPDGMHFQVARILTAAELDALTGKKAAQPKAPEIRVPVNQGPAFEVVVNNTGTNIGPGIVCDNTLYVPARLLLRELNLDIINYGDLRNRTGQPRYYIEVGAKK